MNPLLLALVILALLVALAALGAIVTLIRKQNRMVAELRGQVIQDSQNRDNQAVNAITGLTAAITARNQFENETHTGIQRLVAVLTGSASRGAAGENIVEQSLRNLPNELIERDFWVNGKVVEFALRLPGGKMLAIDSKWSSIGVMEALSAPNLDPAEAIRLTKQLEKEVEMKVREVAQYLDHATTAPFAIAAVPDAVYAICRKVFAVAQSRNVVIVSYSLTLPYLLSLYQLHQQYGRNLDTGNLEAALLEVDRHLNEIDSSLDNKLQRALTMLQNSYTENKQAVARIRSAVTSIHTAPAGLEAQAEVLVPSLLDAPVLEALAPSGPTDSPAS